MTPLNTLQCCIDDITLASCDVIKRSSLFSAEVIRRGLIGRCLSETLLF